MDEVVRQKFLRSRLISVVPSDVKNFMELVNDKKWPELVSIFENQTDFKDAILRYPYGYLKVDINKTEAWTNRAYHESPEHRNRNYRLDKDEFRDFSQERRHASYRPTPVKSI